MPMSCYSPFNGHLCVIMMGSNELLDSGIPGDWKDAMENNRKTDVSVHEMFSMMICSFLNLWEIYDELTRFNEAELIHLLDYLTKMRIDEIEGRLIRMSYLEIRKRALKIGSRSHQCRCPARPPTPPGLVGPALPA